MRKRIILRVREEVGCPLFRAGDQMVLELPGIDKAASTNLCTLAVAKFLAERGEWNCEDMKLPVQRREFLCPRQTSPVLFDVLEQEESHAALPLLGNLT